MRPRGSLRNPRWRPRSAAPFRRADILDIALAGKAATVEAIEQDFEKRVYLAVVVDDDPGAELGIARQIAHRFFFAPDEVEPLEECQRDPDHSAET